MEGRAEAAKAHFAEALRLVPSEGPSRVLLEQCRGNAAPKGGALRSEGRDALRDENVGLGH